jgi:hypothetical protein
MPGDTGRCLPSSASLSRSRSDGPASWRSRLSPMLASKVHARSRSGDGFMAACWSGAFISSARLSQGPRLCCLTSPRQPFPWSSASSACAGWLDEKDSRRSSRRARIAAHSSSPPPVLLAPPMPTHLPRSTPLNGAPDVSGRRKQGSHARECTRTAFSLAPRQISMSPSSVLTLTPFWHAPRTVLTSWTSSQARPPTFQTPNLRGHAPGHDARSEQADGESCSADPPLKSWPSGATSSWQRHGESQARGLRLRLSRHQTATPHEHQSSTSRRSRCVIGQHRTHLGDAARRTPRHHLHPSRRRIRRGPRGQLCRQAQPAWTSTTSLCAATARSSSSRSPIW